MGRAPRRITARSLGRPPGRCGARTGCDPRRGLVAAHRYRSGQTGHGSRRPRSRCGPQRRTLVPSTTSTTVPCVFSPLSTNQTRQSARTSSGCPRTSSADRCGAPSGWLRSPSADCCARDCSPNPPSFSLPATLTVGGSFDGLAVNWGLPAESSARPDSGTAIGTEAPSDASAFRWNSLDVGSPFDHAKAGIIYIARHLPTPGRDGLSPVYLDEIAELVEAAGGRALGLFSSMRAAKAASEAMRERLDTPILCQGDDATGTLVKAFAKDEPTSLFGTLSLWAGRRCSGSVTEPRHLGPDSVPGARTTHC